MFPKNFYSGPGRKKKLSGGIIVFLVIVLIIQVGIILYAAILAARSRVKIVWLDPYLRLEIQGADGYAVTNPVFDEEGFCNELKALLLSEKKDLDQEEADRLTGKIAQSLTYDINVETADGRTGVNVEEEEDEGEESLQDAIELPVPGISNGDIVTVYAIVDKDAWRELWNDGFHFTFECDPVQITASDLPEANPYDPFEDLSVSFTGMNGVGEAVLSYNGIYPLVFTASPSDGLRNGETVDIQVQLSDGYDLDSIVRDYQIMPISLAQQYTVSGLYVNPTGIESFTAENREKLMMEGREAARALLNDEYEENEQFVLDDDQMYFAVSTAVDESGALDENSGIQEDESAETSTEETAAASSSAAQNYLFCLFKVNYVNNSGEELAYYYYIRFENLMLDDSGEVIADYRQVQYPHKPSIPVIGEALGDGAEVSVPGFLSFRTLAGYDTRDELVSRVITPLETTFTVTTLEE